MMRTRILRDSDGKWKFQATPRRFNPTYVDSLMKHLNAFSPLFDKAKNTCEFEFILTLLRVRGSQDRGWDPFENTRKVFACISGLRKKTRDSETRLHLSLWLYGHIVEASEPYETLANLVNICAGGHFTFSNFPDKGKYAIPQSPSEKIDILERMASEIGMSSSILPLRDVFDRDLRNAIFHADYSLSGGEVRIRKPVRSYSHDESLGIINKALAYYEAFVSVFESCIRSYDKPRIVAVPKDFGHHLNQKAITIIRKGHGLVGIKDNWTEQELKKGYIPFRLGRFYRYESDLMEKDPLLTILPLDRIKITNSILKILPKFARRYFVKRLENRF